MNTVQLNRYKKLIKYIDENFKEDLNIEKITEVSQYSYRNINRVFQALHQQPIGQYIKRLRLEKSAQYLKYSDTPIIEIAMEVGFEDHAAFTKAFKKRYNCAPSAFRNSAQSIQNIIQESLHQKLPERKKLEYEIEILPDFDFICLTYRGDYNDHETIGTMWKDVIQYGIQHNLIKSDTPIMAEIIDDNEITDVVHCRYSMAIVLSKPLSSEPIGLFQVKSHTRHKYAKFIHKGDRKKMDNTYQEIYSFWMNDVPFELEDSPTLEFYLNDESTTPSDELRTEIYIPVS